MTSHLFISTNKTFVLKNFFGANIFSSFRVKRNKKVSAKSFCKFVQLNENFHANLVYFPHFKSQIRKKLYF